jgi:Methylase involved in ubiquinone/menaquinone biosynthesis
MQKTAEEGKMIDKKDVIEFFNGHASTWDDEIVCSDSKINTILDNADICPGKIILDVACGTGVLVPYYLQRNVSSVTGVDISPEMIKIAAEKFPMENVSFVCADAEKDDIGAEYDAVVIYNAFPHFSNPELLISRLSELLKEGGTLTVAHGMSRETIDAHHKGSAHAVSNGLMQAEELAELIGKYLTVTTVISNDEMYQIAGKKSAL